MKLRVTVVECLLLCSARAAAGLWFDDERPRPRRVGIDDDVAGIVLGSG